MIHLFDPLAIFGQTPKIHSSMMGVILALAPASFHELFHQIHGLLILLPPPTDKEGLTKVMGVATAEPPATWHLRNATKICRNSTLMMF